MAHYVICPYCSERYNRDNTETVIVGRRYYHKKCYELKSAKDQQETQDKQVLINYIQELFNIPQLTKKIMSQIEKFRVSYDYTYTGMYKSLKWFYETKQNPITKANDGIGIIPYIYEEAKQYYQNLFFIQENSIRKNEDYTSKVVTFTIPNPKKKVKQKKLFNI